MSHLANPGQEKSGIFPCYSKDYFIRLLAFGDGDSASDVEPAALAARALRVVDRAQQGSVAAMLRASCKVALSMW